MPPSARSPPRSACSSLTSATARVSRVDSIDPATAAPLGSAFKLYVLDALGNAVASGKVRWNQPLTVTAQLKSLPSGELQNEPDGTQISVQDTAAKMISISDNTAANMLINLLGRSAVEAALSTTGMADPVLDRPFLTTRGLPGHHPDRAELCRHRTRRESVAAHQRGHRGTGHAFGDQGSVHARGAPLISGSFRNPQTSRPRRHNA